MPDASDGPGLTDPHGMGGALSRLGDGSRKVGRAACLVAVTVLEPGEQVEVAAIGRFLGAAAVVLVTDRRMVVVNDRPWDPDIVSVTLAPGLEVQGWQDGRSTALRFHQGPDDLVVDQIVDADAARHIAGIIRQRAGG